MDIPRLHSDTIREVKEKIDIIDLVSEVIVLKKKGREYSGLCPFHDEKSPSFTVNPDKQVYHCFGCGAGGDGIKFLMEIGKQSFSEVVFSLAKKYQVPITSLSPERRQQIERELSIKEQLHEIMSMGVGFYQQCLNQSQGKKALDYLRSSRRLNENTIADFQLGYSPDNWESLYSYLVEQKRYPVELVAQLGLIKPRQGKNGYYDQFRDRLMIPIFDKQGQAIAFGSRTLGNEQPKYLNSPDTPLFEKGKTLFALDRAKQAIIQQDLAIVVEGYFDAIALHAAGITNVVACLGTALSQEQIKLLLRYSESKQIIFNFDADQAGIKATQRAIEAISLLVYSGQVNLKILSLPNGKDADGFLMSHPDGNYKELIKSSPFWIDWQISQILADKDLKQGVCFQQASRQIVGLLQKLTDINQRTFYLSYCAEILSQGKSDRLPYTLKSLTEQVDKSTNKPTVIKKENTSKVEKSGVEKAEWLLLSIYVNFPKQKDLICEVLEKKDLIFNIPDCRYLWQLILSQGDQQDLVSHLQDCLSAINKSDILDLLLQLDKNNDLDQQIKDAVLVMEKDSLIRYRSHCQEKVIYSDGDRKEFYQQEFNRVTSKLVDLVSKQ